MYQKFDCAITVLCILYYVLARYSEIEVYKQNKKLTVTLMKSIVTLIGTLPPLKGISPYCQELLKSLSKNIEVEFIGFKKLYPDFWYLGGRR